jgi:putative DeoR family transcriptional regulator (stage III sporulation protein D)
MRKDLQAALIRRRTIAIAMFIVENHATTREAGRKFGLHCTNVCRDMNNRLKELDSDLYAKVRKVFDENTEENRANIALARGLAGWRKKNALNNH